MAAPSLRHLVPPISVLAGQPPGCVCLGERYKNAAPSSANSIPLTGVTGTTVGNLLVLAFCFANTLAGTAVVTGVTDVGGNTWVLQVAQTATTTNQACMFAYTFLTAAPGTITVATTGGANSNGTAAKIEEFTGVKAFDTSANNQAQGPGTTATTPSATPSEAWELTICAVYSNARQTAFSPGTGFTQAGTSCNVSLSPDVGIEFILLGTAGAQTASMTLNGSSQWGSVLAFFTTSNSDPIVDTRNRRRRVLNRR